VSSCHKWAMHEDDHAGFSNIVFVSHVHDVHGFTAVVVWLDILPYCSICADDVILHEL
jgi:hypothetical protein